MKTETAPILKEALKLHSGLGGIYLDGNKVRQDYLNIMLLHRIQSLEDDHFAMIGALQQLGADRCDKCGEWETKFFQVKDTCICERCFDPEWFIDADGDGSLELGLLQILVRSDRIHLLPHINQTTRKRCKRGDRDAILAQPWLELYRNNFKT